MLAYENIEFMELSCTVSLIRKIVVTKICYIMFILAFLLQRFIEDIIHNLELRLSGVYSTKRYTFLYYIESNEKTSI
jgi:hypothetical protein